MQLNEFITQLNLSVSEGNNLVTQQDLTAVVWKNNFATKFGQLTVTPVNYENNGTQVLLKVRTDDPNNITRLSPVFGDAGIYGGRFFFGVTGSGSLRYQCTGPVQAGAANAPKVAYWKKGTQAILGLQQYTPVATFHGGNSDEYDSDQGQHTGIYVGADSEGIFILSQNMEGTGQSLVGGLDLRRFPFSPSSSVLIAGANNYYRVMRQPTGCLTSERYLFVILRHSGKLKEGG